VNRIILLPAFLLVASSAFAQQPTERPAESKSTAERFFVGVGYEGNALKLDALTATESGSGFGLTVGYGFTPRWSLYTALSAASMDSADGLGTYGLGHFDVGTRVHFLAGPHRVVPFMQIGLAGQGVAVDVPTRFGTRRVTANGAGVSFGGGLNAHFNPKLAFTGHITWTAGALGNTKVDGTATTIPFSSTATSARVGVGLTWFPAGARK